MHGPKFATQMPTAFAPPGLNRSPNPNSKATAATATPKLAFSNPLISPLTAQKPFSSQGFKDPRTALRITPSLVSLRAHGNQNDLDSLDKNDAKAQLLQDETEGSEAPQDAQAPADEASNTETVPADTNIEEKGGFKNPLPGVEIGIPLNILASFFSNLRYGENVLGLDDAILQACLGYLTYGTDRLLDAYTETGEISEKKQALYDDIKKNVLPMVGAIAASSAHAFNTLNQRPETRPFIPLLASTFLYKQLKENFGEMKPFYIAAMWTAASVILPAVMHDHDFSILASPQDYLPAALLMFGSTNLADAKDIAEDKEKGIETLPVKLGKPTSDFISYAALGTAAIMIGSQLFGQ